MQAGKIAFLSILISISSYTVTAEETKTLPENPVAAPSPVLANSTSTLSTNLAALTNAASGLTNDVASSSTNEAPLEMDVRVKLESGPGQIPASRAYITVGTNRFAFLVPSGFKVDTSDPQRVTLVRADCACLVSLRILQLPANGLTPADCREKLSQQFPGCTVEGEFSLGAANSGGPAFEIHWKGDGGVRRAARVAYIPLRAGVVEFSLDSNPDKYGAMVGHLNYVMLTFRASDPDGRLEPTPLSDRI